MCRPETRRLMKKTAIIFIICSLLFNGCATAVMKSDSKPGMPCDYYKQVGRNILSGPYSPENFINDTYLYTGLTAYPESKKNFEMAMRDADEYTGLDRIGVIMGAVISAAGIAMLISDGWVHTSGCTPTPVVNAGGYLMGAGLVSILFFIPKGFIDQINFRKDLANSFKALNSEC